MVKSEHRNALLEKYRCINVEYDEYDEWWDCVYADFKEDMREVGICVDRMYFSGFSSQGDGACFEGSFDNLRTYLDHHHKDQYPMIRKLLASDGYVYVTSRGMYCHANSMVFSIEHDTFYRLIECPTEFHEQIVDTWDRHLEDEASDFEKDVIEQWQSYMQDLYCKLEAEYDYLVSDEAVWGTIEANELDMDEEDLDEAA
jgi:hypothetical protein